MRKPGFRTKIYVGMLILLLLLGAGIFAAVSRIMKDTLLAESRLRGVSLGTNLAARLAEPMLSLDFLRIKTLVDETVRLSDDIFYAFVLDVRGNPLVHTFKGGFPIELQDVNGVLPHQGQSIRLLDTGAQLVDDFALPVKIDGEPLGTVRLGLERTHMQAAFRALLISTFMVAAGVILLAGFAGTALARTVTKRIKVLHDSTEKALRGDLNVLTAPLLKRNCWEIMDCRQKACPAFGNRYHRCWYLAGTLCPTCTEGQYAKKISTCTTCQVYRQCAGDEIQSLAESFDAMILAHKEHLGQQADTQNILTQQRQLLRTILDATPDLVSLQDRHLVYRAANKAFCAILGRSEGEIIQRTNHDLFPEHLAQIYQQEDRQILADGQPLVKENEIEGRQGKKWLHVMKIPVRDDQGNITGLLCSGRDITGFKKVQEQLTQAQKMETVGQLTAGIAHEINTPLGIILGYAQLLLEDVAPAGQIHDDLKTVEKQAKICRKIVRDLLSFSRHTESRMGQVDLNAALVEVIGVVAHTFSLDHIDIVGRFGDQVPPVFGDEEKLKQVMINLLNNARDAIGRYGTITVATFAGKENQGAVIEVVDTGCGIPADHLDRIFEPFFTTKAVSQGTGLGLAVTFGIVKEHGGRIEVTSPWPEQDAAIPTKSGTRFTIYLPAVEGRPTKEGKHG